MSDGEQRRITRVTAASAIIFGMLVGSYVLMLWLLPTLGAVDESGETWWLALVVVLAIGGAAGLGFSYQILRLIGARDLLSRLESVSAETLARCQPDEVSVDDDSDVETVHNLWAQWDQELIPVLDEWQTLDGVITASDLATKRHARTARELMTDRPTVARASDSLADVLFLMRTSGHDNIPVVNGNGRYLGTITPRLMLEALQGEPRPTSCEEQERPVQRE